jgi:hypothetical protein
MNAPPSPDAPVHSIAIRKTLMIVFAVLLLVGFIPVLLQYKGLIDAENFGVPESYLYVGGFAASFSGLIAIFVVWRCPRCGAYLGREGNPPQCHRCGAKFS